ncbi:thermonuclease family protein [Actinomycetospora atypica]|uniref:Thermonuclease family protein n=1 Tax=Actinomycetospora atypica TaxID=1290095 RepID=A0ABV9YST8_9PSEU
MAGIAMAAASIATVLTVGLAGAVTYAALEGDTAQIIRVIDGDTFEAAVDGNRQTVRLLNVDTPETRHPDEAVQCLGPEATDYLASVLAPGDTVTLTYDEQRLDAYGRVLAGVREDGDLINAEIARRGLGVAKLYEPNGRYYGEVLDGQQEAEAEGVGLYSPNIACTLPARVVAVEQMEAVAIPVTPEAMDGTAAHLAGSAASAAAVLEWFNRSHIGLAWEAFTADGRTTLRQRVANASDRMRSSAGDWSSRATVVRAQQAEAIRVAEAERVRLELDRARVEQEARDAADTQRRAEAAARSEKQRVEAAARAEQGRIEAAARADRRRAAAAEADAARRAPSPAPKASSRPSPSSSGQGSYPGYNGPRCYAPGGKTWRPC